jgi:hypothetical protein
MELPNKNDIETSIHQAIQQAVKLVPDDMTRFQEDVEKNLKAALQAAFSKMELVSREEFDIQAELLSRTRALLEELEKKINDLEQTGNP